MFLLFEKGKNNSDEDIKLTPWNTSRAWAIEQGLLEMYFLLAYRIKGLGWSLSDFWKTDTWTTSKLYCMELDVIDDENKELNKDKPEYQNSEEVTELVEEMFDEG
jgi:hypothetical protein